jgi:hypothetical protein
MRLFVCSMIALTASLVIAMIMMPTHWKLCIWMGRVDEILCTDHVLVWIITIAPVIFIYVLNDLRKTRCSDK